MKMYGVVAKLNKHKRKEKLDKPISALFSLFSDYLWGNIYGLVVLRSRMSLQVVAKTPEFPSIQIMLERIRDNHIDIIPILQAELETFLPHYIEEIVNNVYVEMKGGDNE